MGVEIGLTKKIKRYSQEPNMSAKVWASIICKMGLTKEGYYVEFPKDNSPPEDEKRVSATMKKNDYWLGVLNRSRRLSG